MDKRGLVVAVGLVGGMVLAGCAQPPTRAIAALKQRGITSPELDEELRAQEQKFSLFRSYNRTEQLVAALQNGTPTPQGPPSLFDAPKATKCVEDNNVACFCFEHQITCVQKGK